MMHINDDPTAAAEGVLQQDESLSKLVETALQESIARRCMQAQFSAQGRAARQQGRCSDDLFDANDVVTDRARAHASERGSPG
ncbi:hypothetical protein [Paraburkholderia sp. Ac-20347]|uniref:hypothetical protein n=1 Tax=Paraburkholderia sp. Ac-20347 TaxID=2703892 RepID=UPI00197E535E|nr:hypothetical protein [Paraburkholderia sp. Ac-20347]MBN3808755.1 hypothetical protein [Paraburkholderia sp. Ac-20347]